MQCVHFKRAGVLCFAAVVLFLTPSGSQAGSISGNIVVTFSNPVLSGFVANNPVAGQTAFTDNTSTAVYMIANGATSSSLSWGAYSESSNPGFQPYSQLTFTGSTIPANNSAPFVAGTLVYTNGTSDLNSLIFSASLNFYANSVSTSNFLGSDQIVITTTSNVFGVPGGLTSGDDDYVNICGTFSGICGTSIEAVESSEGGTGISVNLIGSIVGDPTLQLTSVALTPGQNANTNGFLGNDPALGTAPEPASWSAAALGMCALGFLYLRSKVRQS